MSANERFDCIWTNRKIVSVNFLQNSVRNWDESVLFSILCVLSIFKIWKNNNELKLKGIWSYVEITGRRDRDVEITGCFCIKMNFLDGTEELHRDNEMSKYKRGRDNGWRLYLFLSKWSKIRLFGLKWRHTWKMRRHTTIFFEIFNISRGTTFTRLAWKRF